MKRFQISWFILALFCMGCEACNCSRMVVIPPDQFESAKSDGGENQDAEPKEEKVVACMSPLFSHVFEKGELSNLTLAPYHPYYFGVMLEGPTIERFERIGEKYSLEKSIKVPYQFEDSYSPRIGMSSSGWETAFPMHSVKGEKFSPCAVNYENFGVFNVLKNPSTCPWMEKPFDVSLRFVGSNSFYVVFTAPDQKSYFIRKWKGPGKQLLFEKIVIVNGVSVGKIETSRDGFLAVERRNSGQLVLVMRDFDGVITSSEFLLDTPPIVKTVAINGEVMFAEKGKIYFPFMRLQPISLFDESNSRSIAGVVYRHPYLYALVNEEKKGLKIIRHNLNGPQCEVLLQKEEIKRGVHMVELLGDAFVVGWSTMNGSKSGFEVQVFSTK